MLSILENYFKIVPSVLIPIGPQIIYYPHILVVDNPRLRSPLFYL
jgi:hypothetical protein